MKKLSNNELVTLDRCEQEWVWHYAHGLRAPPSAPMLLGQLVHAGVKELYGTADAEWRVTARLAGADVEQRVLRLVDGYEREWFSGGKPKGFDVVWNEGHAESVLEQAIPDRCVRAHGDGLLYAMDLKTTSMYVTPAWQRHFEHNQQVAMQLDVLEHVLGERLAGFWLDYINVGKKLDFGRFGPIAYSEALRLELRRQREKKRDRIAELRLVPENAEKRTESCVRYNALCPFFDLCRADASDQAALVQIKLERGELTCQQEATA